MEYLLRLTWDADWWIMRDPKHHVVSEDLCIVVIVLVSVLVPEEALVLCVEVVLLVASGISVGWLDKVLVATDLVRVDLLWHLAAMHVHVVIIASSFVNIHISCCCST